jgi:16S rRNA (cytosine967-C5)-methyltransferase
MIAPARRAAFDLLERIATTDAHSDELLRSRIVNALSPQDRNLVTTLVLGVLRWQQTLDAAIRPWLARPNQRLSEPVKLALRLGAFQLLHLDRIPAHAVLSDSVELVKQSSERGAAGMVNAILRRLAALPGRQASDAVAAHPEWMVKRWRDVYGREAAAAICNHDQEPGPVALRLLDASAAENLRNEGVECVPGELLTGSLRVVRGDVTRTEAFRQGRLRIQEEGSQLIAELAAAALPDAQRVLDACAAPGGKTAILAERLQNAKILATDISPRRLEQMKRLLQPYAGRVDFAGMDAARLPREPQYDLILCDAPCSGTGTIARNPEIRFRLQEEEFARQRQRQVAILKSAARALRAGGRVVYSTCSLEPEENEAVLQQVLDEGGLRTVTVAAVVEKLAAESVLSPGGAEIVRSAVANEVLRTVPGVHPCDGFFAAILEKQA